MAGSQDYSADDMEGVAAGGDQPGGFRDDAGVHGDGINSRHLMSGILIIGAGGHGKVVADILLRQSIAVLGFLDDDPAMWGTFRLGLPVLGAINTFSDYSPEGLVIGIGSNVMRREIVRRLGSLAYDLWQPAVHPEAVIAPSASIGRGTVIAAGAVVNPDTCLGDHVIINTGATVDHDCYIGDFVHIAPGAHMAGSVRISEGALLGIGSVAIPGSAIGEWATVGAGAVVLGNIPGHAIAVGVPARWSFKGE